jgi:hypothetical protein
MKPGTRVMHGKVLAVAEELEPSPPGMHFFVEGGRWWGGG